MSAALFDLDGCLVDSRAPIAAAINVGLEQVGARPVPVEDLYGYIGPPLLSSLQSILQGLDADPALAESAVEAYRGVYPDLSTRLTTLMPGVGELLADLDGHVDLMVVTSKPREFAVPILEALDVAHRFIEIYGPSLQALTEPKAVKLREALVALGLEQTPRQAAMIGDRKHDVLAGVECGTRTIGVTWGIGDREELEQAGADVMVDTAAQLGDHLLTAPVNRPQRSA